LAPGATVPETSYEGIHSDLLRTFRPQQLPSSNVLSLFRSPATCACRAYMVLSVWPSRDASGSFIAARCASMQGTSRRLERQSGPFRSSSRFGVANCNAIKHPLFQLA
jgi:hypothetical protein